MIIYDKEFIKQIMDFEKELEGNWLEELENPEKHKSFKSQPRWKIHSLQTATRVLFRVLNYQMNDANRIHSILEKLPDTEEFKAVKQELKQVREETISTLIPIKKLAESMESSKNKKLDYIG